MRFWRYAWRWATGSNEGLGIRERVNLKLVSFIVPLLGLVASGVATAQIFSGTKPTPPPQRPIPVLAAPGPAFVYPPHETLTFTVDWRVFPAGTAVLHFDATGDRERITANADTIGAINLLFHVGDRFQSTFDRV